MASASATLSTVKSLSYDAAGRAAVTRNLERFDARRIDYVEVRVKYVAP